MTSNPNASIAAISGAITSLIVFVVGQFGVTVPAEIGGAVTTLVIAGILFVGRRSATPPPAISTSGTAAPTTTTTTTGKPPGQ